MENFPAWEDFLRQEKKVNQELSNFLINARIKTNYKYSVELTLKKLDKPLSIISQKIYDNSIGSKEDKSIKILSFLGKVKELGNKNYKDVTEKLNEIFETSNFNIIKKNESLLKHIQELLMNDYSDIEQDIIRKDRLDIIRKEIQVNTNLTNIRIVTDTPINTDNNINEGVLDFPIFSSLISNIIENSYPRFSVGIFGGWGTGKTTLMNMIQNKLNHVEEISWNLEQYKLIDFIRKTHKIDWLDPKKVTKLENYTVIFEDPNTEGPVDSKGTYDIQYNKLIIQANDNEMIVTLNDNIIQELRTKKENDDLKIYLTDKKILTVWFDAWRYEQEENLPIIALIRSISLAVDNFISLQQPKERTYWEGIKNSLLRSAIAFISSSKVTYGIKDVVSIETDFKNMLESYNGDGTVMDDKNLLYFQADGYLQRAIKKLRDEKDERYRIVVFIDDLDRCTPEKALKILESIKSFFDMEGIIFIIALNYNGINSIIKEKYGNNPNISGYDYMEKIVQLPFHIPEWSDNDIGKFLDYIINNDVRDSIFENEIRLNKQLIIHSVERNPRQVKRFINDIILARFIFKKPVDNLISVEALKFRKEWNKFLEFIFQDEKREQFLTAYQKIKNDSHILDRWKEDLDKVYPTFFNEHDPLRKFLDAGGADNLNSIKNMEEYRRALESVYETLFTNLKAGISNFIKNFPFLLNSTLGLSNSGLTSMNLNQKLSILEELKTKLKDESNKIQSEN
ncbi:MAG: KAP family P-loop NTPase fold protein [Nitrososphaeraceae archaeon]